MLTNLYTK